MRASQGTHMLLLLALATRAYADDYLQVDAGAPGMAVVVSILRDVGGFTGTEALTTNCADITVGPVVALDSSADPSTPITGAVLQSVFYIDGSAATANCRVYIDGTQLSSLSGGIDNRFRIVTPESAPVDGGTNDFDGAADGVITLSSSLRSDGGTVVFESLDVPAGTTLLFDTTDPNSGSLGNEAFLPAVILVEGTATIEGSIWLGGIDGEDAVDSHASDGGDGGPGGGGGGVGSNCNGAAAYIPGNGFTGGGGTSTGTCIDYTDGGNGAVEGNDMEDGGEGVFTTVTNRARGYAGGTGGGTGHPWGTAGDGGLCCGTAGDGGFGGGGGPGHSDASGWGAGGGGFGTSGENGIGTVGGSSSGYNIGGAGLENGSALLVPLAGGSGGGGGDSGSSGADGAGGGGGGGALLLVAESLVFSSGATVEAYGGNGGNTDGVNPGSSTGGAGGSGGGVFLAANTLSGLSGVSFDLTGGYGGSESTGYYSGDGGEGRLRVDGAEAPSLSAGPTGNSASAWEGPAISGLSDTQLTVVSDGDVTLYIYDSTGSYVTELTLAEDSTTDLSSYVVDGDNLLALADASTGVLGPAGVAVMSVSFDADGDGHDAERFGGDDCDDDDASVSPSADEVCNGVDDDCDGDIDTTAIDAPTWYLDADFDGYGNGGVYSTQCDAPADYVDNGDDCDDADASKNPAAAETTGDEVDYDCDGGEVCNADADSDRYSGDDTVVSADTDCDDSGENQATDLSGDCDDSRSWINPGRSEIAGNDYDENCDDAVSCYADVDNDGYRTSDVTSSTDLDCRDSGEGRLTDPDDDCDDANSSINPGATEVCDSADTDEDCDGLVDDLDPDVSGGSTAVYDDADGDGYGDDSTAAYTCEVGPGQVTVGGDCNDIDAAINPGATEVCDALDTDEDCDGLADDADPSATGQDTYYDDADGDGYGDLAVAQSSCDGSASTVVNDDDCDDSDGLVNPSASETVGNEVDDNCDGTEDCHVDADGDGYADDSLTVSSTDSDCDDPGEADSSLAGGDCDDGDIAYNPGATEACDDPTDYNCDGSVAYADADGDGWAACEECDDANAGAYPGAPEEPGDGVDSDCDGYELCYTDLDDDDYRPDDTTALSANVACDGAGEADNSSVTGDCDDTDDMYHPGADELDCTDPNDYNCDGSVGYADDDADGYPACEDCDDRNADANLAATEVEDGADNDCDGLTDEGTSAYDDDGDGQSENDGDCDDDDASTYTGAPELEDGVDNDCDGDVDEDFATDTGDTGDSGGDDTAHDSGDSGGDDSGVDTGDSGDDSGETSDSGGDSGDDSGDDTGTGETGDTDTPGDSDVGQVDKDDDVAGGGGCGCDAGTGGAGVAAVIAGLALARRRRA